MKRLEKLKVSKFENLTEDEMASTKGGLCISCMKRERKVESAIYYGEFYVRW